MDRNTLTTLDKLSLGDRFHKAGDARKKVYTKTDDGYAQADGETYGKTWKRNYQIIFLRSQIVKPKK